MIRFEWDAAKNRRNATKHGISFETAVLAFDDPWAMTLKDESSDEERWITMGAVGPRAIILIVHTWFEVDGEEVIRIISARAAESQERKIYEEAHPEAASRNRYDRRQKKRRD